MDTQFDAFKALWTAVAYRENFGVGYHGSKNRSRKDYGVLFYSKRRSRGWSDRKNNPQRILSFIMYYASSK